MKIKKLAAIDIGSNAMRLLIKNVYEIPNNKPVFNKTSIVRMPIRLGEDVFIEKKISQKNTTRLVNAMKAYKLMMDIYGVEHYLAYATSAMRESENGKEIVKKIKQQSGINIQIIDGNTEAELIFATELQNFILDENNYLYVDVGGGSTELTLITNGKVSTSRSFPIGTVRLLEGKVGSSVYPEMKTWIEQNVRKYGVDLIGSGGNINHVYKYSGVKLGKPLSGTYLRSRYKVIREMSYEQRLKELNMKPDRADVVEFALEIYTKVMKWSKAQKIFVPKIGISDGMIRYLYQQVKND
ncbi:MAG: Ppx/GppA phosphatase family protein [Moheibacter sp.]